MSIPIADIKYGFVDQSLGAHLARTIMVDELGLLFRVRSLENDTIDYRKAIIEDNVPAEKDHRDKGSNHTRLRQLYGLTPFIFIFQGNTGIVGCYQTAADHFLLCCVPWDAIPHFTLHG